MKEKKYAIRQNKRNVSRTEFFRAVKNSCLVLRLYRAKEIQFMYLMPYGGMEECNDYNFSEVYFKKSTTNDNSTHPE